MRKRRVKRMRERRCDRLLDAFVVLLLAAAVPLAAQEDPHAHHDHAHAPVAPRHVSPEARARGEAFASELESPVITPFVTRHRSQLEAGSGLRSLASLLRAVARDIESRLAAAVVSDEAPERGVAIEAAFKRLRAALVETGTTPEAKERLGEFFDATFEEHRAMRRGALWGSLMCWCPKENFTRTLSGCPDGCAEEQKHLIEDWLTAGLTNAEIVERMVAHDKGSEKVRGYLKPESFNLLSYALPALFLIIATFVLLAFLQRAKRPGGGRELQASSMRTGRGAAGDEAWDDEIERKLKEMED